MPKPPRKPNGGRHRIQNRAGTSLWGSRFECRKSDGVHELMLYGTIGGWFGDITANSVARALKEAGGKRVRVRLNTPGGDVFEATAINNLLKSYDGEVEAVVDGIVASAGVHLMQGASTVSMASNAMLMIHNPWSVQVGEAADMRKHADLLDKVRETIITSYQERSELSAEELAEMMDAETWMTAKEAKSHGFIDAITGKSDAAPEEGEELPDASEMKNQLSILIAQMRSPQNSPDVPGAPAEPVVSPKEDSTMNPKIKGALLAHELIESFDASDAECKAALKGYFRNAVPEKDEDILNALKGGSQSPGSNPEPVDVKAAVNAALAEAEARNQAENSRQSEIRALCGKAGIADLADQFIKDGAAVASVQAAIIDRLTAKNAAVEDDNDENTAGKPQGETAYDEAYAKHKASGGKCSKEAFIRSMQIDAGELSLDPAFT